MKKALFLSFNVWQINFLLKCALVFCYYNKQWLTALELVLYEFDANKKCQVSLVVKYSCHTNVNIMHQSSLITALSHYTNMPM